MIEFQKTGDSRTALTISIVFHSAIVLLIFIFGFGFVVPDPPLGSESVMLTLKDFGMDNDAAGDVESNSPSETVTEAAQTSPQTTPTQNTPVPVVTQTTSTTSTPTTTQTTTKPVATEPQIDPGLNNILDMINNNNGGGGSQGQTSGQGNQGAEDGNIDGNGVFDGGGWSLVGRGIVGYPTLGEDIKEEGKVVLDIWVDRNGKVTASSVNIAKSNTSSSYLFELAKKAAKTAKFNVKQDAPPSQSGSMTFIFKLN
jgi:periplasmic protein TonB